MTINSLFTDSTQPANILSGGTLAGTQQLTNTASIIADGVLATVNSNIEAYADRITASQSDMTALDKLVSDLYDIKAVDITFLKAINEDTLEGMLKSQQSKRSRCKSKEMTVDNYKSMMTASISETLLRAALGKEKGVYGGRASATVGYDEDRLIKLAADQDALRKEIRNVQSKKSIMKSKAGFTEADERWEALLTAEEQLKSIRTDNTPVIIKTVADPLREQLAELLAEVEETTMTAKHLKELVASIKSYVWPEETEEAEEASFDPSNDLQ